MRLGSSNCRCSSSAAPGPSGPCGLVSCPMLAAAVIKRDLGWFAAQVRVVEVSSGEAASGAECRVGVLERRLDGR